MHKQINAQVVNHETWGRVAQIMNRLFSHEILLELLVEAHQKY